MWKEMARHGCCVMMWLFFDGVVSSLRRFKEDVKEVQTGYECGIGLDNFGDIKPGDIFEIYLIEEVAAEL